MCAAIHPLKVLLLLLHLSPCIQYACNVCGTCIAFLLSGICYHYQHLFGAACLGAAFELVLLVGSLQYLTADSKCTTIALQPEDSKGLTPQSTAEVAKRGCKELGSTQPAVTAQQTDSVHLQDCDSAALEDLSLWQCDTDISASPQVSFTCTIQPHMRQMSAIQQVYLAIQQQQKQQKQHTTQMLDCDQSPPNLNQVDLQHDSDNQAVHISTDEPSWISYIIAITFCVQAVLIGTVLSTAPLLLSDSLGLGVLHVGLAFSGEATALVYSLYKLSAV